MVDVWVWLVWVDLLFGLLGLVDEVVVVYCKVLELYGNVICVYLGVLILLFVCKDIVVVV